MKRTAQNSLMVGTAVCAVLSMSTPVLAQQGSDDGEGLDVIIVTAQKREQNVQDVPIAVTALSSEALEANRITSVEDLSSMAPGLTVNEAVGGARLPSFSMRGAVSLGVTPGTDKQISTYIDGVYLAAGRGSIFNLPNLQSIEVLRGPQGTLFGRNATAGAINIRTRDPDGEFGVKATGTVGNQNEYDFTIGVDLPQVGPFSAYVNFVREKRDGDIRNVGQHWTFDRTASAVGISRNVRETAKYLGSTDAHSIFAAVKYETGDFTTVYKFDWAKDHYTPQANVMTAVNPGFTTNGIGPFVNALVLSQSSPVIFAPDGKRPDTANNTWVVPGESKAHGHNVTSTLLVSNRISLKNIIAYRVTENWAASAVAGIDGLPLTAAAAPLFALPTSLIGQPVALSATQGNYKNRSLSDEFQINYDSDFLTAIVGGLYFLGKDDENNHLLQPTVRFTPVANGIITQRNIGRFFNRAKSIAAYGQMEFHLTPQIDAIFGGRITNDKKSGYLDTGTTPTTLIRIPFKADDTRFTYLIGVNYKPSDDILIYGKYSTAYVSGGSVAGIPFEAETVKSFEVGAKTEFLNRKVRANIALYHADYDNVQYVGGASTFAALIGQLTGDPNRASRIQSFIINPGSPLVAKGVELDVTVAPTRGATFGGNVGYTDAKYDKPGDILPLLLASNGGQFVATGRPKWVGNVFAQYDTPPVIDGGYISFRMDVGFQSKKLMLSNPDVIASYAAGALATKAYTVVNGRIALKELPLGGAKAEFALWGKNIFDRRDKASAYDVRFGAVENFIKARAYGFDVTFEY